NPKECQQLFDAFVKAHGEPAREGILDYLFGDLDHPGTHAQSRRLLIQLYGKKKDVKSTERPKYPGALASLEKADLIRKGLVHDSSPKIDRAVRDLLASIKDDDALALACMTRLLGRGYGKEIAAYCRRRLPVCSPHWRKDFQLMLDRRDWTR